MKNRGLLVLEDGSSYQGFGFGAAVEGFGEVVFTTGMTGYQETCTDPSFHGQMVVFTYPLIGNYGINREDVESRRPWVAGVIVREYCLQYSNWRAEADLDGYLKFHGVPGLYGVDTRALTRHLRTFGTMRGVLVPDSQAFTVEELAARARSVTPLAERPLVAETSVQESYVFVSPPQPVARVVLVDCGLKESIARSLARRGVEVVIVPHSGTEADILALKPDGVVFSNGPGDPSVIPWVVETAKGILAAKTPFLGICLGHHVLAQAIGASTSRLKFGHHGGNHPVRDVLTGRVHITSQNHEFQVDAASIPRESGFFVSHINLNDGSVEGLAHKEQPVFSIQYHPEGSPGPQDNQYVFDRFVAMVRM